MILNKGTVLNGYGNTVIQLLSKINKAGFAKVKVISVGLLLNTKEGDTLDNFQVNGGAIYFEE